MKIIFFLIYFFLQLTIQCIAQDVIVKKSGDTLLAKVLEISNAELKYKKYEFQEGPVYVMLISEITEILYENGMKDTFNIKSNEILNKSAEYSNEFFIKGQRDASKYYDGYEGAGTLTLITSVLSPLVGLIPAIVCSSTKPSEKSLNFPKPDLAVRRDYYLGYTNKAKKKKQGRVWTNWGIGLGVNIIAVTFLLSE